MAPVAPNLSLFMVMAVIRKHDCFLSGNNARVAEDLIEDAENT